MKRVLSPKPILDSAALTKALNSGGIVLKNGQLDLFYQLLHRRGYPPLDEFVAELRGGSVSVSSGGVAPHANFRMKNAISSRPGRGSQLPKAFLSFLANNIEKFATLTSSVQTHQTSVDGTTTKIAVQLQDGHVVESVLMRHEGRVTICVSSQVGCAMGCTFCATGTMGIRGNLTSGEILEQLVHGSRMLASNVELGETCKGKRLDIIRNVVFMGMGEPLNNYPNVLAACRALINRRVWNLAHNRVTVSTVGVVSRMRALTRDLPEVNLALSLHAPNQAMREKIVPAAKGTPIESLIEALDEHMMALTKRRKLVGNPQGCDQDGNVEGAAEFDKEERQTASKKKRAMIEYVMCKFTSDLKHIILFFISYWSSSHFIDLRYSGGGHVVNRCGSPARKTLSGAPSCGQSDPIQQNRRGRRTELPERRAHAGISGHRAVLRVVLLDSPNHGGGHRRGVRPACR